MTDHRSKPPLSVLVRGDFACFTRPELKVERVSYPVMTPSAARGVLEAIVWKPAMRWRVERIKVLNPIRFTGIRRNEVSNAAAMPSRATLDDGGGYEVTVAEARRQQRNTVALRDVAYVIEARIEMTSHAGPGDNLAKFVDMFRRRVERGQCFQQPFLGMREMAADFEAPAGDERPIGETRELGLMLWDMEYRRASGKGQRPTIAWREAGEVVNGSARPVFFAASMKNGVIEVPATIEAAEASIAAAHGVGSFESEGGA